ncbi:MAG: C_GCAxxG_C_C family protein [Clostridia bacterium]|nr:C_GCAxxG_C_C family protein [Clostridia bacterium]
MDIEKTPGGRALELFLQGYNCCQAVFAAYSGRFGMDPGAALRLTAGMGGGMGGMRGKCGAVTALFLLAGLRDGGYPPGDGDAKKAVYARVQELDAAFESRCSSTVCQTLLEKAECGFSSVPSLRDAAYYESRPCAALVQAAAVIAEERLLPLPDERRG